MLMMTVDVALDNPAAVALAQHPQLAGGPNFLATELEPRRNAQGRVIGHRFVHVQPLGWNVAAQLPDRVQQGAHDA